MALKQLVIKKNLYVAIVHVRLPDTWPFKMYFFFIYFEWVGGSACRYTHNLYQETFFGWIVLSGWAMDLSVPCIVEGRSELRNAGRVNCKTHWPFSGCGTPYLLNEFVTLQFSFLEIAVRLVECSLLFTDFASCVRAIYCFVHLHA